jgi:hypothetical protein
VFVKRRMVESMVIQPAFQLIEVIFFVITR